MTMKPNAVVSTVIRIEPPLDRPAPEMLRTEKGLSVELEEGRRARLEPDDPRSAGFAEILDGLSKLRRPVYVEVDPETSAIARVLIPHVARVVGIRPIEADALGIELEPSHARHVLRRSAPDFDELEMQLREAQRTSAPVILTEDDAHEIIDVRAYTPGPEGAPTPFPEPEPPQRLSWPRRWISDFARIWRWVSWPFHCVSPAQAQQVFDSMNATSCDPFTVPAPCIPFLYPDDGCWARAHEMCRLMLNTDLEPRKVWIEGTLRVPTRNVQYCRVEWYWHVAPTLCVRGRPVWPRWLYWPLGRRTMVIDPALFTTPVSTARWKGAQGDPNAVLTNSDSSRYRLGGSTDPNYTQTNSHLAFFRLQLQARAIQEGPPPYANCL